MSADFKTSVDRWIDARVIDLETAERILFFESERRREKRSRWPILVMIGVAAVLLGAGILLFVAAHWDELSPWSRFALVLAKVAAFHLGGILASKRNRHLALALHLVGTIALGAAIYLTGQIFNLNEHWPAGLMLWALGAWLGYGLLRDWGHFALGAVLTPAWLVGEWTVATEFVSSRSANLVVSEGLLIVAIIYFVAIGRESTLLRRALMWIGGLAIIPCWAVLRFDRYSWATDAPSARLLILGWSVAIVGTLIVGFRLRRDVLPNMIAIVAWVLVLGSFPSDETSTNLLAFGLAALGPFLWTLAGGMALARWGMAEHRAERVNMGIAFMAIAIFDFYFSYLMDKLGRSQMLISLGLLMLAASWLLERSRRRMLSRMNRSQA